MLFLSPRPKVMQVKDTGYVGENPILDEEDGQHALKAKTVRIWLFNRVSDPIRIEDKHVRTIVIDVCEDRIEDGPDATEALCGVLNCNFGASKMSPSSSPTSTIFPAMG
ncbi:hypothetical protein [Rhizobium sp.]|uniref:hypothetical protein n=1 Tax=Rhizobium sp. TaxID=391 RepID=UPI002899BCAC